jgi:NAD+ kinase
MRVGLYFNKNYLSDNERNLHVIESSLKKANIDCIVVDGEEQLDGLDVLMVLGGDGTILMLASQCAKRKIKIIGINYGHKGFLAEFEPDKLSDAIALVCSGKYNTQKRSMLKVELNGKIYYAVNDLVVQRNTAGNNFTNTINLRAEIDGATVDNFLADGLIVSTPTGSTAYSLSAGGSILTPKIQAFILTPICAHSLHSRPIVFSDNSTLKIYQSDSKNLLNIIIDGKVVDMVENFDHITVCKSEDYVEFITANDSNFFNKLLIKLNKWSK